ncbi:DUF4012 domain-containing protein [Rhodococcus sp. BP-252]|uniref:DUF4012 domain-containing protein n=1 Tax=unclassified Rhodococcus (in: high G+C Gram-positive bacteria) TaxID=192944 RepID=UPI001C9A2D5E|nr:MULTISPECIES: DUF4012 domain-containing protein [unclassified Rhodococcus (in: high G+C Gram-positive bacteria)]MBY6412261.1 DUF4012 domain-containing protein [Rhodococcus sp. BP-320]MBY6416841.1 DUF4012 domain-containing protein [Rhodococcus sp. BP-321]MBY6421621.1 DUF4012 domain-containing protein [Rhodococcus sp. BP-324]MBY6426887.1 DUF4012 domain-containing protein [Rhodococcus sp. BP-323]MBY6432053.1 DUF4012 domain-containing protein [Rhodococcus sp. BP-322]
MSDNAHSGTPASGRRRPLLIGLAVAVLIVVSFGVWLGYCTYSARTNLETTRDAATRAKDALLTGDVPAARIAAAEAADAADAARTNTSALPMKVAAAVPWLGSPVDTVVQITDVVHGLAVDVLEPATEAGATISPDSVVEGGGRVNLQALSDAEPVLAQTSAAADELYRRAQSIDDPAFLSVVGEAREQLQNQTHDLASLLGNTYTATRLLPKMMGADGPRSYFLAFQTPAEARGTGGLIGGYGILRAENGTAEIDKLGTTRELKFAERPIDLGPEYNALWGPRNTTVDFRNSNASANFPYAGQIWTSMWTEQTGESLDGAIATDPIALSYLLGATGPVRLADGEEITADNVVEVTLSSSYARFGDDQLARKMYLQEIAAAVVTKMTSGVAPTRALIDALGRAGSEGRIAVWSADASAQEILAGSAIGHALPDDPAPYAGVVVNNAGGNKLDYYLTRDITYTAEACTGPTRKSTVTATLTNNVQADGLTTYVASTFLQGVPYGTNESIAYLYGTQGAKITSMSIDGAPAFSVQSGTELGRPVKAAYLSIAPGESSTVTWELEEPSVPGQASVPVQPLVDTPAVTVDVPECR